MTTAGNAGATPGLPVVEGYADLTQIGRGGFATVYKARQVRFDRVVAVKVLDLANPEQADRERFDRECRAIGALSWHPGIVVVHDSGVTEDGRLYLAMEYLEKGSFADRVRGGGRVPWTEVLRAGVEVAGALETAHQAGTLHRDLKPDNVLVGVFGEAKLGDFGIAAVEGGPATATGSSALTVLYAAPEVLRGQRATQRSDVFSLASTLHTLLAGRAAFARFTDESIAAAVMRAVAEPAPDLRPLGVPDDMVTVLEQAMAKDPEGRPPSAEAFGRALQRVQQVHGLAVTDMRLDPRRAAAPGSGLGDDAPTVLVGAALAGAETGPPPPPPPPPPPAPAPSRRGVYVALGVLLVVLLVGAGLFLTKGGDGSTPGAASTSTSERATTTTAVPTTTTAVPGTTATPTTAPVSPFASTTPEEAAQGLLEAWTVGDRAAAGQFGEQSVVADLFVRPTGGEGSTFEGCVDNADATFSCALRFEGGATVFTVSAPPGGRFRVTEATSIAD